MGKKKDKDSESEDCPGSKLKTNDYGDASGKLSRTVKNSRPATKCSTVIISFVLITALSIFLGLIFVELNVSNKDIQERLLRSDSSKEKETRDKLDKVPSMSDEIGRDSIHEKPVTPATSSSPSSSKPDQMEESAPSARGQRDPVTDHPPKSKKVKREEDSTVEAKLPQDTKDETPAKAREEKIREIEKQIVTEKPQTTQKPAEKPQTTQKPAEKPQTTQKPAEKPTPKPAEAKKQPDDIEGSRKRDSADEKPAAAPSPKIKDKVKAASNIKSDEESKSDLGTLYTEVENLADEILEQEPDNEMVNELAPHLKGVLKNLEQGRLSGLKDSLIHIKSILLDLKERLPQSKNKPADTTGPKAHPSAGSASGKEDNGRVPVEEVIPDPVYIAPRGEEKTGEPRQPAAKPDSRHREEKPPSGKAPEQVKPKDVPQATGDASLKMKQEKKEALKVDSKKIVADKVAETNKQKDKVEKFKQKEREGKNLHLSKKISEKVTQTNKATEQVQQIPVEAVVPKTGQVADQVQQIPVETVVIPPHEQVQQIPVETVVTPLVQTREQVQQIPAEKLVTTPVQTREQVQQIPVEKVVTPPVQTREQVQQIPAETMVPQAHQPPEQVQQIPVETVVTPPVQAPEKVQQVPAETMVPKVKPINEQLSKVEMKEQENPEKKISQTEKKSQKGQQKETDKPVEPKEKVSKEVQKKKIKTDSKAAGGTAESPPETLRQKPSQDRARETTKEKPPRTQSSKPHRHTGSQKERSSESEADARMEAKLKSAESLGDEKLLEALSIYEALLQKKPKMPRVLLGRAKVLANLSRVEKSNQRLQEAIVAYTHIIDLADESASLVPKDILREAALGCSDKLEFRGWYRDGVEILKRALVHFPDDVTFLNKMGILFLNTQQNSKAKEVYERILKISPEDGSAMAHYGFILKIDSKNSEELRKSIVYLEKGIKSGVENIESDSRFYYHCGDAYQRLGEYKKAYELYDIGVARGLFPSRYQRSLYNVDRLTSQPIWTPEETTYEKFFRKLESQWKKIAEEGMKALSLEIDFSSKSKIGYRSEAENLSDKGKWGMFDLFTSGKKNVDHCKLAPITCSLVEAFPPAARCTRGQIKFSVMTAGTHVFSHTGPTNCRLRAHLGLVTPVGAYMRLVNETLEWEPGKLFIFDDSFEHEVWHEGENVRLILIVDVWHPDLTQEEKRTLRPI